MVAYSYVKGLATMRTTVLLLLADSHKPSTEQEKEKQTKKSIRHYYLFHGYKFQK